MLPSCPASLPLLLFRPPRYLWHPPASCQPAPRPSSGADHTQAHREGETHVHTYTDTQSQTQTETHIDTHQLCTPHPGCRQVHLAHTVVYLAFTREANMKTQACSCQDLMWDTWRSVESDVVFTFGPAPPPRPSSKLTMWSMTNWSDSLVGMPLEEGADNLRSPPLLRLSSSSPPPLLTLLSLSSTLLGTEFVPRVFLVPCLCTPSL